FSFIKLMFFLNGKSIYNMKTLIVVLASLIVASVTLGCEDKNKYCSRWTNFCDIDSFVKANCQKTCNICPGTCEDLNPNCPKWKKQYCSYHSYVKTQCRKTCNLCHITTLLPPKSSPSTSPPSTSSPSTSPPQTSPLQKSTPKTSDLPATFI
uniref:ShKT domain-containing protein n=1 Tax=Clytia hemisphaerica TaxID=252671 RepID=A0A7M5UPG3_9CNID